MKYTERMNENEFLKFVDSYGDRRTTRGGTLLFGKSCRSYRSGGFAGTAEMRDTTEHWCQVLVEDRGSAAGTESP